MADTDDMVNIAQDELQEFVRQNARCVRKAKQAVVGKDGPQSHCACMEDSLETEAAETAMAVYDLNLFPYDDIAEDGEEGEDGWEGGFAVNDKEGHVVDLEPVREVSDTGSACVGMGDDYDFVTAINEFLQQVRCARSVLRGRTKNSHLRADRCDFRLRLHPMR